MITLSELYKSLSKDIENKVETRVVGKNGMLIGDLHLSDGYKGKFKSYFVNCALVMREIEEQAIKKQPSFIIFTGDIIGVNEYFLQDRRALLLVQLWFKRLNIIANNNVFCVRGNHDMGEFTEFDYLEQLGVFKTAKTCGGHFDYYSPTNLEVPEVRFHLVDYGYERKPIQLSESEDTSDIIVAHNNFIINGVTNWYNQHDGIELCTLTNWVGAYMVISGHIHHPSPEVVSTTFIDGEVVHLFYAGSPTRPSKDQLKHDSVWLMTFNAEEGGVTWDAEQLNLPDKNEIAYIDSEFIEEKSEEEVQDEIRHEQLNEVLQEMLTYRISNGNIIEQIKKIPNASTEAVKLACEYVQLAIDSKAVSKVED